MKGLTAILGAVVLVYLLCGDVVADGVADNGIPDFTYDSASGEITVDGDGAELNAFTIPAMDPGDDHFEDTFGGGYWQYIYFADEAQFYDGSFAAGSGVVTDGPYLIMMVDSALGEDDFGSIYYGTLNSGSGWTEMTVVPEPATLALLAIGAVAGLLRNRR